MKLAAALLLALALPACASYAPEGGSTTNKSGTDEWYPYSPSGVKEFGRQGGYGAVGVTKGFEQFDSSATGGLQADDSDLGITLRGGYRSKEGLAFEGCIDSVTGYTIDGGPGNKADLDMQSFGLRGKYYLGKGRVQPYAFVGAGYTWIQIDTPGFRNDNGIFVNMGAGVDVYITLDVGLFLEGSYARTTGDIRNLDHADVSGGIIFRF